MNSLQMNNLQMNNLQMNNLQMNNLQMNNTPSVNSSIKPNVRFIEELKVMSYDDSFLNGDELWYSKREQSQFKRSIIPTVQLMRTGFCPAYDNEQHCYRGLEHYQSREHIEQRRLKRKRIVAIVLETQAKQRSAGISDPMEIATLYANISVCSKQQAAQFGRQDEFVSMQLHRKQFMIAPYVSGNAVVTDVDANDENTCTQIYTSLPSEEHLERIRSNKKRKTLRIQKEFTPYYAKESIGGPRVHKRRTIHF
eukprot:scaffold56730_cov58-Attheya_sp.AAC.2